MARSGQGGCSMNFLQLVVATPFLVCGFIYQWMRDMFVRGRAFYDFITSE
jgi:hypothetical protein